MSPESGPEQFRIHSSIVSKLLAFPKIQLEGIKKLNNTRLIKIEKQNSNLTSTSSKNEEFTIALFGIKIEPSEFSLAITLAHS